MRDNDELEFYADGEGDVRWRYRSAGNNETLADSAEGYGELRDAMASAYRVVNLGDVERHALIASATESIAANRPDGSLVRVTFTGV